MSVCSNDLTGLETCHFNKFSNIWTNFQAYGQNGDIWSRLEITCSIEAWQIIIIISTNLQLSVED